jgi:uncharacterized membrane protein (UPF0127 family)
MRKNLLILLLSLWILVVFTEGVDADKRRPVALPSGRQIDAEVADTPEARAKGLMFRDQLPAEGGMLFIFQQAAPHQFWMKNCKFPIDIIWLNDRKEIIYISPDTPPCKSDPCPNYGPPSGKALYVLEVASGLVQKEKLKPGMKLQF